MKTKLITLTLLSIFMATSVVQAQKLINRKEKKKDKREISADGKALQDDRRDLGRLTELVMEWDTLRKINDDSPAMKRVEQEIAA